MTTIVNNPNGAPVERTTRVVERADNSGWAVAVIILLAVVVIGVFLWVRYETPAAPASAPAAQTTTPGAANINVVLPQDNSGTSGASANTNASTTQ